MFSQEQLEQLETKKLEALQTGLDLAFRITFRDYRTEKSREYASHGFSRRLRMLGHCLERLFYTLPPNSLPLPTRESVHDAEAFLHSFLINCYGALDNLAHIWVAEFNVFAPNGLPLGRHNIGLTAKYTAVRSSLPEAVLEKLVSYEGWFSYLEDYRHSLAHRIPVYIADRAYRPGDVQVITDLRARKDAAYHARDFDLVHQLMDEEAQVGVFNSLMMHSYGENARPVYFHSQMLRDHSTVVEFATLMFDAMDA